jgi:hypothetical protein
MSRIPDLGDKYCKLPDILDEYHNTIAQVEAILKFGGKTLEEANKENPAWTYYYDQRKVELNTLVKFFENEVKRVTAKLYKSYKENQGINISLSERELLRWIEDEVSLKLVKSLLLEVTEVYDIYHAISNAFQSRGYALNNITRARVAEVHDVIL